MRVKPDITRLGHPGLAPNRSSSWGRREAADRGGADGGAGV